MKDDIVFLTAKKALKQTRDKLLRSSNDVLDNSGNIKTTADFIANETLISLFKEANISCRIFSEEQEESTLLLDGKYDIIIDPVDNSYLFVKGINAFSSIAMIVLENNDLKYSFVQSLDTEDLYYCDNEHAYLNGKKLTVIEKEPCLIAGYAAVSGKFDYMLKLKALDRKFYFLNTCGPLLAAMVADNRLSASVEFTPTSFHEAAGAFIAQKAGAYFETVDGRPFVFDPSIKQTIIVANSENLLREIQHVLRS